MEERTITSITTIMSDGSEVTLPIGSEIQNVTVNYEGFDMPLNTYLEMRLGNVKVNNATDTVAGVIKVRYDSTANTLYMTNTGENA